MGTMRRRQQAPQPSHTSLIASAAQMRGDCTIGSVINTSKARDWQRAAYQMYQEIAEYRYACDWVGSMLSKAVLTPRLRIGRGRYEDVNEGLAHEYLEDLFSTPEGRSEALRAIGLHMTISGEAWIIGYETTDPMVEEGAQWAVVSPHNVARLTDRRWKIGSEVLDVDPDSVMAIRIWRPDPSDPNEAISPSRPLIPILSEIKKLTQHVAAQVDSRLAGAGILLMPSEMTFPEPPEETGADGNPVTRQHYNDAESLMEAIQNAMSTAIANRDHASALVPIVITAPAEAIQAAKHLTFWTELDRQAIELRSEAIRRLALGMDMPPEVLTGNADVNHWNAWQSDESAIKAHTEPLLKLITSGISEGYLRPMLMASGMSQEEIRNYSIGADTSEMRLRPNRSKEAFELYDRGEISGTALRKETGFYPDDKMSDEELRSWFTRKVASGSTTPDLVEGALRSLGLNLGTTTQGESGEGEEETQEARPTPSLKDRRDSPTPDYERGLRQKEIRDNPNGVHLIADAADMLVLRALERAGNKMKNQMKVKPRVAAFELYQSIDVKEDEVDFLLEDAWPQAGRLADRHGMDEATLIGWLHQYTLDLIRNAEPHSYEKLQEHLATKMEESK